MRRWWFVFSSTLSVFLVTLGLAIVSPTAAYAIAPDTLVISTVMSASEGSSFDVTVTAMAGSSVDTSYSGTVSLTSTTDGSLSITPQAAVSGTTTFTGVTFGPSTVGQENLTASDGGTSTPGTATVDVYGSVNHLAYQAPVPPAAQASGSAFNVKVAAEDSSGDVVTDYTGTIHFTLGDTDSGALVGSTPLSSYTYPYVSGDNGVHTFSVTLVKGDAAQTLTATDSTNSTGAATIDVLPARFSLQATPSTITAGVDLTSLSVSAVDSDDTPDTAYNGDAGLSSSDPQAGLPSPQALVSGTTTFSHDVQFKTAGEDGITATDPSDTGLTGSVDVQVDPAGATQLLTTGPGSATAGTGFSATYTAEDPYGNVDTNYSGSIVPSSTIGSVTPTSVAISGGTVTTSLTIDQAGTGTISGTATPSVTAFPSSSFTVSPGTVAKLVISDVSTDPIAGTPYAAGITIKAEDAESNVVSGDDDSLAISDSAGSGTLSPTSAPLVNGQVTINPTFTKAASQTITATDLTTSLSKTSGQFTVDPGTPAKFVVDPSTTTPDEGIPFTDTVTVLDSDNNVVTGYSGSFDFLTTDALNGVFPTGAQTLTNGTGTFPVTLYGTGNQNIDVVDIADATLTGESGNIDVQSTTSKLTGPGTVNTSAVSTTQTLNFTLSAVDSTTHDALDIPSTVYGSSDATVDCGAIPGLTCTFNPKTISGTGPYTFTVSVSLPTGCFAPQTVTLNLLTPTSGDLALSSNGTPVSATGTLDIAPTCNLALSVGSPGSVALPAGGHLTFPITLTDPTHASTPTPALQQLTIPYTISCPLAVIGCGTLTGNAVIDVGDDSTTVTVPVSQLKNAYFTPQMVSLTISTPLDNSDVAVLGTGTESGTVTSKLPLPRITLSPPPGLGSITMPADAGKSYTYTVTLSEPVAVPVHVTFAAHGAPGFASPAVNGVDFTVISQAECNPGTTCVDFDVPVSGVDPMTQSIVIKFLGRGVHGPSRYFQLALASTTVGGIAPGQSITTILTDTYAYGYWLVGTDGGVFPLGAAPYKGSASGDHLSAPVVAIAPTPTGQGYWLVSTDGGVYSYGDSHFYGSMYGARHNGVIVGIAATPTGKGYWLVGSDGGVYAFGDAGFYGSMSGSKLVGSIVGIQATRDGRGYYLVGADGGVFAFGDAVFRGSLPDFCGVCAGSSPILGIAISPDGGGYWLASDNGGVFAFGDARYEGSAFGTGKHFEAITATSSGDGYWLLASDGSVIAEGKAKNFYNPLIASGVHLGGPVENMAGD